MAVSDIQRIESDRDFVLLHTPWRSHVVRATMNELEQKLWPAELLRVHRGAFVRPQPSRGSRATGARRCGCRGPRRVGGGGGSIHYE